MATPAVFDTSFILPDNLKKSFAANLVRTQPNGTAPLFALTAMTGAKSAVQIKHGYFTKAMVFPQAQLTAALTAGATTVPLSNVDHMVPGMVMRIVSTGENIRVSAVDTVAKTVTVSRAFGTVSAAAAAANDWVYQVGTAFEQASVRPQANSLQPQYIDNNTQIFRNSWAIAGTADAVQTYVGMGEMAENRQDCASFHAQDIEKALFFGQKSLSTLNNQVLSTMDGLESVIRQYAPANIYTAGATTSYDQLEAALDPVFSVATDPKVANERVLFVGGKALRVINKIGRLTGQYQILDGTTNFGLQFSTFKIPRGTFRMIEHPLLNSNPWLASSAWAVDLSTFDIAWLRKTFHKGYGMAGEIAGDNGVDAMGGTLTSELTTEIKNPAANGIVFGLTDGVAS